MLFFYRTPCFIVASHCSLEEIISLIFLMALEIVSFLALKDVAMFSNFVVVVVVLLLALAPVFL